MKGNLKIFADHESEGAEAVHKSLKFKFQRAIVSGAGGGGKRENHKLSSIVGRSWKSNLQIASCVRLPFGTVGYL